MGRHMEGCSKVRERFMTVMNLARTGRHKGKELAGIVINPFTEPFVLPRELYETVEKTGIRVKDENGEGG